MGKLIGVFVLTMVALGCSASVVDESGAGGAEGDELVCDWRFVDGCIVRGEEGDACQTEAFCQDGLRCARPSDDRRTWECVLDE